MPVKRVSRLVSYSISVEAAINPLVNMHLWAFCTYLLLGCSFHLNNVPLEGVGHFCELTEEIAKAPSVS